SAGVSIFVAVTTTGSVCFTSCAVAALAASTSAITVAIVRIIRHSFSAKGLDDSLRAGFLTRGSSRSSMPSHRRARDSGSLAGGTRTTLPTHSGATVPASHRLPSHPERVTRDRLGPHPLS